MSLTLNTNIDSIVAQNNLNGFAVAAVPVADATVVGLAHQQRRRRRGGSCDRSAVLTQINGTNQAINNAKTPCPNRRPPPARSPRSSTICRASVPSRWKRPTARTAPRTAGSRPAGAAADRGNHPDRAADKFQRPESAERLERRADATRSARTSATRSRSTRPGRAAPTRSVGVATSTTAVTTTAH